MAVSSADYATREQRYPRQAIAGPKTAPHAGDIVSITAYDASLTGTTPVGQETASYSVVSGNSSSVIASNLASNIGTAMSNIGVTATATGATISIKTSPSHATQFTCAVSGSGATDTISLSGSTPIQPLHAQLYCNYDCAGNLVGVQGDSSGSFPTGLTTAATAYKYNNLNQLTNSAAGGAIRFVASTVNPIKAAVVNVSQSATIKAPTIQPGDVLTLLVHDKGLAQSENVDCPILAGDSTTTIASRLAANIGSDSVLSALGVTATASGAIVTISSTSVNPTTYTSAASSGATESIEIGGSTGAAGIISPAKAFTSDPILAAGQNTAFVTAVSGGGTRKTDTYPITINSATPGAFSYDNNGNQTNVTAGSYPQYGYDAEDRLIKVIYDNSGNNYSTLSYDPLGRCIKLVETTSGTSAGPLQFVWCGSDRCEVRNQSDALLNQYFSLGQINISAGVGTSYLYTKDHLGSIREMGHMSSGSYVLDSQYDYDPYGKQTKIAGSGPNADFGFAGLYTHQRSGLNLTLFRAYSPSLGHWLSRDPLGESAGTNLYAYVGNDPVGGTDPLGLQARYANIEGVSMSGGAPPSDAQIINMVKDIFRSGPQRDVNLNLLSEGAAEHGKTSLSKSVFVFVAHGVQGQFASDLNFNVHTMTYSPKDVANSIRATESFTDTSMVFGGACWTGSKSSKGNIPASEIARLLHRPTLGVDGTYAPGGGPQAHGGRPGQYVLFNPLGVEIARFGAK